MASSVYAVAMADRAYNAAWRAANPHRVAAYKKKKDDAQAIKTAKLRAARAARDERLAAEVAERRRVRLVRPKKTPTADQNRRGWLRYKWGLTPEEYNEILEAQGGLCAICGTDRCSTGGRFVVDHDHSTGVIRSLLCSLCNKGLGCFLDDPKLLEASIGYLAAHKASPSSKKIPISRQNPPPEHR